ncbi:MAG: methanol oxidation system protein MoxJ [Paracoccus sp. (in: a-proteobacteria)]|uniref:methanol oxidation system protein MoxJ n=1 Tax=Paracoccus sp. TaxID=267 RepID=UPI0026E04256|nr:methanol oxidation system protein MoxJ [Paracoccus sp. (in: a-proteobacteria)]MDO5622738.1 methanol oxidation system protein MoxJ [Paracoccus sp. (in: a-proteobacteria)]
MISRFGCGTVALLCSLGATNAQAADTLRVCASTMDAPYSTRNGTGFENRIAEVLADEAGMTLDLVMINKDAIYLVRDGIEDDLCDVLIGVDQDDKRLLTSKPYYRSAYAFIGREDRNFDGDKWQDIDREGFDTFSYRYHSPAETILKYTGRYEYNLIYQASLTDFEDRRNKYTQVPADRVVSEVAAGNADLGIAFAPDVARYVRDSRVPLKLTLITNEIERQDGLIIPLQYSQSVGVAKTKPELLERIDQALETGRDRIQAILDEEGIPTLPLNS